MGTDRHAAAPPAHDDAPQNGRCARRARPSLGATRCNVRPPTVASAGNKMAECRRGQLHLIVADSSRERSPPALFVLYARSTPFESHAQP